MLVGDSYALAVYICVLKGQSHQKDNLRRSVTFSQYFSCGRLPQASKAQKSVTGMNLRKTEKKFHRRCQIAIPNIRPCTLIKKKNKFSSYIRKFRVEQLQSHI
jgi:hypothetical protein